MVHHFLDDQRTDDDDDDDDNNINDDEMTESDEDDGDTVTATAPSSHFTRLYDLPSGGRGLDVQVDRCREHIRGLRQVDDRVVLQPRQRHRRRHQQQHLHDQDG
ncbi:unnamed protein product [Cuscuta epithymum]|uniref:Uncharacterized protein n=1 Tax=Cuscuta epithymum TaxID=186058 RepID=A0AAV0C6Y1_9ASTE|nr:unnamed protein product [Cuscuta epithymum]